MRGAQSVEMSADAITALIVMPPGIRHTDSGS